MLACIRATPVTYFTPTVARLEYAPFSNSATRKSLNDADPSARQLRLFAHTDDLRVGTASTRRDVSLSTRTMSRISVARMVGAVGGD